MELQLTKLSNKYSIQAFKEGFYCYHEFNFYPTSNDHLKPTDELIVDYKKTTVDLDLKVIKKLLKFAAKNDIRYYLNGIFFDTENSTLVSSDGHSMLTVEDHSISDACKPFIVPYDFLECLVKQNINWFDVYSKDQKETIIKVELDNGTLTSRAIDGSFPNWKHIIPVTDNQTIVLKVGVIKQIKKQLSDLKKLDRLHKKKRPIGYSLSFFNDGSESVQLIDCERLEIKSNMLDFTQFSINAEYLLRCFDGNDLAIKAKIDSKITSSITVKSKKAKDDLAVIMPLH